MIVKEENGGIFNEAKISTYRNLRLGGGKRKGDTSEEIAEIEDGKISKILERTAIVVPTKDEDPDMLEKVLRSIPGRCSIVVASDSTQQYPKETYQEEMEIVKQLNKEVVSPIIIVHQENPKTAKIFSQFYPDIIDKRGLPYHGKAVGCIVGTCAALCHQGIDFVGFVDSDNRCPLSVTEYVRSFACGVLLAGDPDNVNVRLRWGGKAYAGDVLSFRNHGSVSTGTNRFFNRLIGSKNGLIETGNAGEELFSTGILLQLPWGARFGMETEFLHYLLQKKRCEIQQIITISSHIHTQRKIDRRSKKMASHTKEMMAESWEVFLSDPEVSEEMKKEIEKKMKSLGVSRTHLKIYPPMETAIKPIAEELEKIIEIIE